MGKKKEKKKERKLEGGLNSFAHLLTITIIGGKHNTMDDSFEQHDNSDPAMKQAKRSVAPARSDLKGV